MYIYHTQYYLFKIHLLKNTRRFAKQCENYFFNVCTKIYSSLHSRKNSFELIIVFFYFKF